MNKRLPYNAISSNMTNQQPVIGTISWIGEVYDGCTPRLCVELAGVSFEATWGNERSGRETCNATLFKTAKMYTYRSYLATRKDDVYRDQFFRVGHTVLLTPETDYDGNAKPTAWWTVSAIFDETFINTAYNEMLKDKILKTKINLKGSIDRTTRLRNNLKYWQQQQPRTIPAIDPEPFNRNIRIPTFAVLEPGGFGCSGPNLNADKYTGERNIFGKVKRCYIHGTLEYAVGYDISSFLCGDFLDLPEQSALVVDIHGKEYEACVVMETAKDTGEKFAFIVSNTAAEKSAARRSLLHGEWLKNGYENIRN